MKEDIKKAEEFVNITILYGNRLGVFEGQIEEYQQAVKNLIAGYKKLEEDNYAYHQLMQMQNKREYRSKFLKDFKAEYGENIMPDYDEIYKRYDRMKKELSNSISKSKVEEKIKNKEKALKNNELEYDEIFEIKRSIREFKELLQEGDK